MQKFKLLHHIIIEGCRFQTRLHYNTNTDHIGIGTYYNYQKKYKNKNKNNRKTKSLHNIVIKECNFNTNLHYDLNTNHIGIGTTFSYRDPNYSKKYSKNNEEILKKQQKQYYQDNKDKIKKRVKKYNKNNKDKISERYKQYYLDNCDPNTIRVESEEFRIMISCRCQKIPVEEFTEFLTDQTYCYKFNNKCKESNREKYNRKCFICGKTEEEQNNRKLSVHHVDMNKQQGCDNIKWKLVPLCSKCHARSHNDLWEGRLEYLLKGQKGL